MYEDAYSDLFAGTAGIVCMLIALAIAVLVIVGTWKIYTKAGEHGWASIIPFYNLFCLYRLTWGQGIYFLLLLIPGANLIIQIITTYKLAKVFGKGTGFFFGLLLLPEIFYIILGFGKAEYVGINK